MEEEFHEERVEGNQALGFLLANDHLLPASLATANKED